MKKSITAEWRKLAFANYIVPSEVVEKLLPAHTKLDFYNGNCLISLVGFQFKNVKLAGFKVPGLADFEEINLRFYVKYFNGAKWIRGTVFISEIVDNPGLSLLANSLYNENYQTLPTAQEIRETEKDLDVKYSWKFNGEWQHIQVKSDKIASPYENNSESEFVLDRPFGYGRLTEKSTNEYHISHASWHTYKVEDYSVKVDFAKQFGAVFSILSSMTPHSVILAEGSPIKLESTRTLE